ncbi:MAG: bifunctional phosphoribosylaminoimidazolecarboxamide formyltransferase/IMP cyclohydrolase [Bacteroidota bacterium]
MSDLKQIKTALVSVYHKENLEGIIQLLQQYNVKFISTGGTQKYIEGFGAEVVPVEEITGYPSILGGRVKTLHPKVFGGILARKDMEADKNEMIQYEIPGIDLVIVDLYPFEETVKSGAPEHEIIEKIDIGGISLIRAAAKNYKDILIVASSAQYLSLNNLLKENKGQSTLAERRKFAMEAFNVSSHYDSAIFNYFNQDEPLSALKISYSKGKKLRYGENPHQNGVFYGNFGEMFEQLHGKEISYNNLLDIDAAVNLINEFSETTFAILKHNNACGLASRPVLADAWKDALAGDPVSAFGGVLIANEKVDKETATEVDKIFFEVIIAPEYDDEALEVLKQKKNRIILILKENTLQKFQVRTVLNGILGQDKDLSTETIDDMEVVTDKKPTSDEIEDLIFANKIVKHTKSNAIVLAKNKQLVASGVGQTSRVDALKQSIAKARSFEFNLTGAVMASDAFFPFADSVEIASEAGISAVIEPGGSVRDKDSIDFCNKNSMSMVFTGVRHFKH